MTQEKGFRQFPNEFAATELDGQKYGEAAQDAVALILSQNDKLRTSVNRAANPGKINSRDAALQARTKMAALRAQDKDVGQLVESIQQQNPFMNPEVISDAMVIVAASQSRIVKLEDIQKLIDCFWYPNRLT